MVGLVPSGLGGGVGEALSAVIAGPTGGVLVCANPTVPIPSVKKQKMTTEGVWLKKGFFIVFSLCFYLKPNK